MRNPGNKRDCARFAVLSPVDQEQARTIAAYLYDGTRTVARCWSLALDEVESPPCAHAVKDTSPWRDSPRVEWVCASCGKEFLRTKGVTR